MGSVRFFGGDYGAEVAEANSLFRSTCATFPCDRSGIRSMSATSIAATDCETCSGAYSSVAIEVVCWAKPTVAVIQWSIWKSRHVEFCTLWIR